MTRLAAQHHVGVNEKDGRKKPPSSSFKTFFLHAHLADKTVGHLFHRKIKYPVRDAVIQLQCTLHHVYTYD